MAGSDYLLVLPACLQFGPQKPRLCRIPEVQAAYGIALPGKEMLFVSVREPECYAIPNTVSSEETVMFYSSWTILNPFKA